MSTDGNAGSGNVGAGHDHTATLEQQFQHFLATTREAREDGTITLAEARHLVSDLTAMACTLVHDLGDSDEGAERLIRAAESAFDQYIEPLNITVIPDGMEKAIDKMLRSGIRPTIQAVVAIFD
jgi:hypothetical protein